ncbi:MAG: TonB-dependent receptor [Acidobacteriota bacterium]|nr:TonB-dependent receptor [Acidobacteriota bacterium]
MLHFVRHRLVPVVLVALLTAGGSIARAAAQVPTAGQPAAEGIHGVVVDQTGLPLPGVTVKLVTGARVLATTVTAGDGTYAFTAGLRGATVVAALDGFETARVPPTRAARIVLALAHAAESTQVVAPAVIPASPTGAAIGGTLTAKTVARLPSAHLRVRESLPLLPSIVRGNDGLLRLGGARPYDSPLLVDGFDVTDPATGLSSLNLPFEAVRGVQVLQDPMDARFGNLVGGVVQIDTTSGDKSTFGVQGFFPRPRFQSPGFGRIEGIFPRVYFGGSSGAHRVRYFAAAEYDFERIPVPGVTTGIGPNFTPTTTTVFGRVDVQATARDAITIEAFTAPGTTTNVGLSPRRDVNAAVDVGTGDLFAGLTDRHVFANESVLTVRFGALTHRATSTPNSSLGVSVLSPAGWQDNWFSRVERHASRYSLGVSWERVLRRGAQTHDLTVAAGLATRRLHGTVRESPVLVRDALGRGVRTVSFGAPSTFAVHDRPGDVAIRDLWSVNERLRLDAGMRMDWNGRFGGATPSARLGGSYDLDEDGDTVLKAGVGRFVGTLPLGVATFAAYPVRTDSLFDPLTGAPLSQAVYTPGLGRLRLPTAVAATVQVERRLSSTLIVQVGFRARNTAASPTLGVTPGGGRLLVSSTGRSTYRGFELAMRKVWSHDQQLFVSYVRASARGELNDFSSLFQEMDAPLLQPGGMARLATDARDRIVAWGTVDLPRKVVISPTIEWHTGFPYSAVTDSYLYLGRPNSRQFPAFMAMDIIAYKTFTVRHRSADLGIQLFNVTDHFNPRDVYPVAGAAGFGTFTNSVGTIVRGFIMIHW